MNLPGDCDVNCLLYVPLRCEVSSVCAHRHNTNINKLLKEMVSWEGSVNGALLLVINFAEIVIMKWKRG